MIPEKNSNLIGKIGSYLQILSKDPHSTAFVPLAEAYRQIGLLHDALEIARFGTRNLPHFCSGFATMGRILGQMGRFDEAFRAYSRALDIDEESHSALVGLARLHLIRSDRELAREVLHNATQFHPDDETIGSMLTALDLPRPWLELPRPAVVDPDVALHIDEEQIVDEPVAPIPTATLAEIYVKQGLTGKAITVYQQILQQNPVNISARERLSQLMDEPETSQETDAAVVDVQDVHVAAHEETAPEGFSDNRPRLSADPVARPSVLTVLENWLAAIRQRRANV